MPLFFVPGNRYTASFAIAIYFNIKVELIIQECWAFIMYWAYLFNMFRRSSDFKCQMWIFLDTLFWIKMRFLFLFFTSLMLWKKLGPSRRKSHIDGNVYLFICSSRESQVKLLFMTISANQSMKSLYFCGPNVDLYSHFLQGSRKAK